MKITLVLRESIFDCKVKITDSFGERHYFISALNEGKTKSSSIIADVFDNEFFISLIPVTSDIQSILNEVDEEDWKDKMAKKATRFLMNSLDKTVLRVGCDYNIVGLQDGDRLDIKLQSYVLGTFDKFDLLELTPMFYNFFEVSSFNERFKLTNAYEINRKDVIKFARAFAFSDVLGNGVLTVVTYPIQVSRIKRLSKNKKILKTLTKFNILDNDKRERILEKQKNFFN